MKGAEKILEIEAAHEIFVEPVFNAIFRFLESSL